MWQSLIGYVKYEFYTLSLPDLDSFFKLQSINKLYFPKNALSCYTLVKQERHDRHNWIGLLISRWGTESNKSSTLRVLVDGGHSLIRVPL